MKKRRARTRTVTRTVRRSASRARGFMPKVQSFFKPMAAGAGGGEIGELVTNMVAPQYAQIGGYAGAYLAAGVKGVLGKVALDLIKGRGLGINLGLGQNTPVEVSV